MRLNVGFWSRIFRSEYVPQIRMLVKALEQRLLPTLKETDIAHEAEAVSDEVWEHFRSMPASEDADMSDFAEAAQDAGISHYLMLTGIRQGLINMFATALYHTFEQQLLQFHRREVLSPAEERDQSLFKLSVLKKRLLDHGVDLETFTSWGKIEELRLVANVVKHAEGESAEQLRTVRPDLFDLPNLKDFWLQPSGTKVSIFLPLVGEDLFVQQQDIHSYKKAIVEFWDELRNALERI